MQADIILTGGLHGLQTFDIGLLNDFDHIDVYKVINGYFISIAQLQN
jgi:hypothetical protein